MTARVLIVDDAITLTGFLKDLIEQDGYLVDTADTAGTARAALSAHPPDIVLLDAELPDGTGYALCQSMRGDPLSREIPVVMMSACSRAVDIEKGQALGADAHLAKPFTASELMSVVARLLTETPGLAGRANA
ncbi:response regulator [Stappia taiwanensis]|uniref:Response regulator n=1 Tax=Stappia taiwanensis TaxID=992267 RepID=A0A838XXA9_9HYPH|nr:response regulator [Stappia taiwanensis]MBA4611533.1 response regulator [Stappia taiwanensis]GGE99523.1 response regulator [Stappia taiwanensis]